MTTRIAIAGINGRMGRELVVAAGEDGDVELIGGVIRPGTADQVPTGIRRRVVEHAEEILPDVDVLIDFTNPDATLSHAHACAVAQRAFVTGTTGLDPSQTDELRALATAIPVLAARNMSIGLNAMLAVLPALVTALEGYDIELIEAHHRHKVDAPSGTALTRGEVIAAARAQILAERAVHGRSGHAPRQPDEIGIHAIRAGGNTGEHTVLFAAEGEEVRLIHRAYSRRTFALGALRAARFVSGRPPGFYAMADIASPTAILATIP